MSYAPHNHVEPDSAHRGFTLIEMLVVIAIIALLASLITGVVTRSIERAYVVKTSSNLRQLHNANLQHAIQYKGFLVPLESSSEGDWINNKRFQEFLGGDQNGWDDWPSVFKTGTPHANTFYQHPPGVVSKGSIGMNIGWNTFHWENDRAFTLDQIGAYPDMIMFADASSYTIRGVFAVNGPRTRVEDAITYGALTYRYKNQACAVANHGGVVRLGYNDLFPREDHEEMWPNSNDLPRLDFRQY